MKNKYLNIPNILTAVRMACAIGLIFAEPVSAIFLTLYLICGLTDAVDGTIARLTGTASEFGAKFDSVADILFYSIMVLRFFPLLLKSISGHIWFVITLIVLIRVMIYLYFAIRYKTIISNHTYLNKLTGFAVFCLPFVIETNFLGEYSVIVSAVALVAVIYELALCFKKSKALAYKKINL